MRLSGLWQRAFPPNGVHSDQASMGDRHGSDEAQFCSLLKGSYEGEIRTGLKAHHRLHRKDVERLACADRSANPVQETACDWILPFEIALKIISPAGVFLIRNAEPASTFRADPLLPVLF
jgi:hypothetical protein